MGTQCPSLESSLPVESLFSSDHPPVLFDNPISLNMAVLEKHGIAISDRTLNSLFEESSLPAITYGGIAINSDESAALNLHPKMRVFENIVPQEVELDIEQCYSKIRWNKKKNNHNGNLSQGNTDANLPHVCSTTEMEHQI